MLNKRNIIFSYGFFLVWLTGFLYNGPLLRFAVDSKLSSELSITYILVPAIVSLLFCFKSKETFDEIRNMKVGILISGLFTGIMFLPCINNCKVLMYICAGILGVSSIGFISGWGAVFVKHLKLKDMIKVMALTICLGKGILSLNKILGALNQIYLMKFIIILSLIISYVYTTKIKNKENEDAYKKIDNYNKSFFILIVTMFLINISGGYILGVIFANMNYHIVNYFLDLIMYIGIFFILLKVNKKVINNNTISIALMIIGIGMVLFIVQNEVTSVIAYFFESFGFLLLDIIIWGSVGKLGYMTKRPFKIFFGCMGINLLGVFVGNLLFIITSDLKIGIVICSISIFVSFMISQVFISEKEKIENEFNALNYYIPNVGLDSLTDREREIVVLMCQKYKNADIANKLYISENTLKTHARKIYSKYNVKNKRELIELNEKFVKK